MTNLWGLGHDMLKQISETMHNSKKTLQQFGKLNTAESASSPAVTNRQEYPCMSYPYVTFIQALYIDWH